MTVLVFSRDPGGARQMLGVQMALEGRLSGVADDGGGLADLRARLGGAGPFLPMVKDFAARVWTDMGEPAAEPWPHDQPAEAVLARRGFSAVLTATGDIDDETPQQLWRAARRAGVPSHAFVDGDFHVARRFRTMAGEAVLPDFVYVPNTKCRDELAELCPPERVSLIPDLILALYRLQLARATAAAAELRRRWGAGEGVRVVLFASENVEELVAMGKEVPYTEYGCLERLLAALRGELTVAGLVPGAADLVVIRRHPKERPGKYSRYEGGTAPRVLASDEGAAAAAILAADLVAGMKSTLLREALDTGKPVVTLVDHDIRGQA